MQKTRLGLAVSALLAAAITGPAQAQDLTQTHFKVIGGWSNDFIHQLVLEPFWKQDIVKLSNNRITADIPSMTELGLKGPETFRLIKLGIFDLGYTVTGYVAGEVPELDGYDLAGVIQDIATLRKVVDVYTPEMDKLLRQRVGVNMLVMWPSPAQVLWCASPVGGLDDMKGKKVRVFAATQADFMTAIGAAPVTMAFSEVVPALQRKVIDCSVTGTLAGNVAKWTEVTTHLYPLTLGWSLGLEVTNVKSWGRLDPKVQAFVSARSNDVMAARAWQIADEGINQGIWCSVGDSRCSWGAEKNVTPAKLTLVPVTAADLAKQKKLVEQVALPRFAERCGKDCTEIWNRSVGKVVGMTAKPAK
ncbi:MAG: TRAP transporter substrate-binding protein [Proteobacteria bacterium]|nr:TRAP transporter substrate-binding protein [Pseudomonadota bacterium]